jgi:iron complex transport system substrate-binding protein
MGSSSAHPNIEAIMELSPDLILADTMMKDEAIKKCGAFGVPVFIGKGSDLAVLPATIRGMGAIFQQETRAEELLAYIGTYQNLISERLQGVSEKPTVYWEWHSQAYKTAGKGKGPDNRILESGGINIGAEAEGSYPIVSAEWVVERNPDVIIKMASREASDEALVQIYEEITHRPGLQSVNAVLNKKTYVTKWSITGGVRSVVGSLYYAKWIHPELFEDIDPQEVHAEILQKYLKVDTITFDMYPREESDD